MKKFDRIDEHSAFASTQSLNIIESLVARAMESSFIARTMPQLDVPGRVSIETILTWEHEAMLTRIRRQFPDDRFDFRAAFFHLHTGCWTPEQAPAADILSAPATIRKLVPVKLFDMHKKKQGFLAPTSTAILGSQPRRGQPDHGSDGVAGEFRHD